MGGMATSSFAAFPDCQCRDLTVPRLAGASSQISAMSLDMDKARSFLPSIQPLRGASIRGDRQQKNPITSCGISWGGGECRALAAGLCWSWRCLQPWGVKVQRTLQPSWAVFFFGCTEWKILACRQNRHCEEEHRAVCLLQEPGLEQQVPHMAKLCQLWAAGEQCWHHPQPSHDGNSFYCCKSPGHTPWKSLKVKSPLCLPTACCWERVQCSSACVSRDNREVASSWPPGLKMVLFYNKHPTDLWQVVTMSGTSNTQAGQGSSPCVINIEQEPASHCR